MEVFRKRHERTFGGIWNTFTDVVYGYTGCDKFWDSAQSECVRGGFVNFLEAGERNELNNGKSTKNKRNSSRVWVINIVIRPANVIVCWDFSNIVHVYNIIVSAVISLGELSAMRYSYVDYSLSISFSVSFPFSLSLSRLPHSMFGYRILP